LQIATLHDFRGLKDTDMEPSHERSIILRPEIAIERFTSGKSRVVATMVNEALVLARNNAIAPGEESPMAQHIRGPSYYLGVGDRDYLEADYTEAVKWFRKAAERGHAEAQYNLAVCYDYGRGVLEDAMQAIKWFRAAAEQGFAKGQYGLGYCYRRGRGVQRSDVQAVKWYRRAAEQGLAEAQYSLALSYQEGYGVQ
jgi:TPR repeat protein